MNPAKEMDPAVLRRLAETALTEDVGPGDVTVQALVPPGTRAAARITAKGPGVLSGTAPAAAVFACMDPAPAVEVLRPDGSTLSPGEAVMAAEGEAAALLTAERTALNFLQHLSGVATLTRRFVHAVEGTRARILDTRKTLPGLRLLEKAAVRHGGGENHRLGLYDMVLIKDNHLALTGEAEEVRAVRAAVARALRSVAPGMKVQVEVTSFSGAIEAGRAGAHLVLLDNMTLSEMAAVVRAFEETFGEGRPLVEASGGVTLETVHAVAQTGVDRISVGMLTHSAPALDLAMDVEFL